jgi:Acyl-ACP thioesterase
MEKIGIYKFHLDSYASDFRGKCTLPLIGSLTLQAATKHAEERGFGYNYVLSKGRAWVLSRLVIEMIEYPDNEQDIIVNTWIANVNKLFTERDFSFEKENGKILGYARSVWASIDLQTRRPANLLENFGITDFIVEKDCPIDNIRKIPSLKDENPEENFTIRYSDLDINNHLTSIKYIEHFMDMFHIDLFKKYEVKRFEIHFVAEATYGNRIFLYKKEETDNTFVLEMRTEENLISAARVTWE